MSNRRVEPYGTEGGANGWPVYEYTETLTGGIKVNRVWTGDPKCPWRVFPIVPRAEDVTTTFTRQASAEPETGEAS